MTPLALGMAVPSSEEFLEVCTPEGGSTGVKKARKLVHQDGDWHRVVHVWLINPHNELLVQKRSLQKESHAGLWDISAAGHVSWGETALEAAVKELSEELGVNLDSGALKDAHLGTHRNMNVLHNGTYIDNEIVEVYLVRIPDWPVTKYVLQKEEVDEVKYMHWQEVEKAYRSKDPTFVVCDVEDGLLCNLFKHLAKYHHSPRMFTGNIEKSIPGMIG